jgi:hypothetical protein
VKKLIRKASFQNQEEGEAITEDNTIAKLPKTNKKD